MRPNPKVRTPPLWGATVVGLTEQNLQERTRTLLLRRSFSLASLQLSECRDYGQLLLIKSNRLYNCSHIKLCGPGYLLAFYVLAKLGTYFRHHSHFIHFSIFIK